MARSDSVLFCPFCRESFEGETMCPEHELELVAFQDLPRQEHERVHVGWDDPVAPLELRFGRGWLMIGSALALAGFVSPVVRGMRDAAPYVYSGWDLARGPAFNLWTVPFVAALFVFAFLVRRRTPLQMRGARIAAIALSLMPALSMGYSMINVARGVARTHGAMTFEWAFGAWIVFAASVFLLVGSVRFGAMPKGGEPHGAGPDREAPPIDAREGRKRRR